MNDVADSCFGNAELERIVDETFVHEVDFHHQIGSTNDRAIELAKSADRKLPLLVLAESQTAGRGRGSNQWWASKGALTFSVLLETGAANLPTESWPQVSLTVGLAIAEALEELLARGVPATSTDTLPPVHLKWPNDVYIEGQKICGVLVEVPPNSAGKLLIGIGININNSTADAPDTLRATATSLADLTGRSFELTDALILVLKRLDDRLQPAEFWTSDVLDGWRKRCWLTGQRIGIDNGTRQSIGICRGIDDTGALLLEVAGLIEKHFAGVISLCRTS